jgi:hypothetical protein
MKFMVDIDGTICTIVGDGDYSNAKPLLKRIHTLNKLYDEGHEIHYWTARGSSSGKNWRELTEMQLKWWGCKYTTMSLGKPSYDVWIDDKASNPNDFFESD